MVTFAIIKNFALYKCANSPLILHLLQTTIHMFRLSIHRTGAKMTEFFRRLHSFWQKLCEFSFFKTNMSKSLLLVAFHCFNNVELLWGQCGKFLFRPKPCLSITKSPFNQNTVLYRKTSAFRLFWRWNKLLLISKPSISVGVFWMTKSAFYHISILQITV